MSNLVTINLNGVEVQVSAGMTVVDAAMRHDVHIPVFCHHPKLEPVGMCRMCLVKIGLPVRDRATGELLRNPDGTPQYNWGKGLQTGCTVRVSEGMAIQTQSPDVLDAREDIIEFILTSHPLDCPICDKGGECPLQNLTLQHGEGTSRFVLSEKMKLEKHVPLGELIYLDRERCIQCARCVRFQDEVVDDPVLAFHNRGRRLEIVTFSEPGFDSIWSGNTTDICPVGALTTADFRFGARPWELIPVASISPHGPAGANITISTRREAKAGGRTVIKRIMPRQNEWVNEIWITDKTRFGHHFVESADRLTTPLIRKNNRLVAASWDEALTLAAQKLRQAGNAAAGLAGDRLSNEDLFQFQKLFRTGLKNNNLDLANKRLAGGDIVAEVGLAGGSNLGELGKGDAILVIASDLHAEEPIWWLRVKQAAQRGAALVVMNLRPTRLDKFADYVVHYSYGAALQAAGELVSAESDHAVALRSAANLVIFYGYEGLTYAETDALARTLGNLLLQSDHVGRKNNGLIPVWPHNNTQGAWDMGINPRLAPGYKDIREPGLDADAIYTGVESGAVKALYVLGSDPVGDGYLSGRGRLDFLIVQELFLTPTAESADVVLPAQSWAERDGTYTSGERRVQRFYAAITKLGDSRPDWQILAQVLNKLTDGAEKVPFGASLVFKELAKAARPYKDMDYRSLAQVVEQFPKVGGEDLYYGGTSYDNTAGMGQQWAVSAETKKPKKPYDVPPIVVADSAGLPLIPIAHNYPPGALLHHSAILSKRMAQAQARLHPDDMQRLNVADGDTLTLRVNDRLESVTVCADQTTPVGLGLLQGLAAHASLASVELAR